MSGERKRYYTLEQACRYVSKTRPYPFVIAHECREVYYNRSAGEEAIRTREYFAFDSFEQFLEHRDLFPHAHEVIFGRFSDMQQGRLIFDFDFDKPWAGVKPNFVPEDFEEEMEKLIGDVFNKFYTNVDVEKLEFVWIVSETFDKWSKHLVVKNAFFAENWKLQIQCFYQLLLGLCHEEKRFRIETEKLIDYQVARNNATMRIVGSTKYEKDKVLEIESGLYNIYDAMVQLYRREDIKKEQHIYLDQRNNKPLDDMIFGDVQTVMHNKFYRKVCELARIDLTRPDSNFSSLDLDDEDVKASFKALENYFECCFKEPFNKAFKVRNVVGSLIDLDRCRQSKCLLSQRVHESENAFLTVKENGEIYFHCRRGCEFKGRKAIRIFKSSVS